MIKEKDPDIILPIQNVELEWVTSQQYLGTWINKRLMPQKYGIIKVIKAMNNPHAGTSHEILIYYLHAIHTITDYSVPAD